MSLWGEYGSERKISPCLCGESTAQRGRSVHVSVGKVRLREEDQSMSLRGKYGSERKISPCLCGESTAQRGRSVHVCGESTARRGRSVHVSEGKVRLGEEDQSMSLRGQYGSERKISPCL
ncbi:hypothetical protein KUCAC02_025093 [Chaenocephalus aceratus]|nr:hypothetical protein KUCAC02_025093 [Chaenocephalus aceratus]